MGGASTPPRSRDPLALAGEQTRPVAEKEQEEIPSREAASGGDTHGCRSAAPGAEGCWFETPVWINRWLPAAESRKTGRRQRDASLDSSHSSASRTFISW